MVMYTSGFNRLLVNGTLLVILSVASGCSSIDRLSQIGEQPKLASIENPTAQPGYKPVQMPMPKPEAVSYNANSLWRNGSRSFFKDQRAHQIGDLLTVTVNITDQANFANETQRSRTNKEDSGITDFLGAKTLGAQAQKILPGRILTADSTCASWAPLGSVTRMIRPPRAATSCMLDTVLSNTRSCGAITITGMVSSISAIGPCLSSPAA